MAAKGLKAGLIPDAAMLAAGIADWASWVLNDYPPQFAEIAARSRAASGAPGTGPGSQDPEPGTGEAS